MKINKEFMSLQRQKINESKKNVKSKKVDSTKVSEKTMKNSSIVNSTINNVKKSFEMQSNISKIQQKIETVKNYEKNNNFETVKQSSYNNKSLFSNDELKSINSSNDLTAIIKNYEKDLGKLSSEVNSQFVQDENKNAINQNIEAIKESINNSFDMSMKTQATNILNLLK